MRKGHGFLTLFCIRNYLALFVFCTSFVTSAHAGDAISRILGNTAEAFISTTDTPKIVSVGNFTYADKGIGSGFSAWIQERLAGSIIATPGFELLARDNLDEILKTLELDLSDLFDQDSAPRLGRLKAVQGIFSGTFFDEGADVRLFVKLLSVESGTVVKEAEVLIPKSLIPPAVSILPDNYNDALFVLKELSEVSNAHNADFVVKAWTGRGEGGTYREGEELAVNFYANRDCFIKIYHIGVDKQMKLIFPNQYHQDNRIQGKRLYTIPDSSYPFKFMFTKPLGSEFIKVIASTLQFKDIEEAFTSMGAASSRVITRGLDVAARPEQVTEALIGYTIVGVAQ